MFYGQFIGLYYSFMNLGLHFHLVRNILMPSPEEIIQTVKIWSSERPSNRSSSSDPPFSIHLIQIFYIPVVLMAGTSSNKSVGEFCKKYADVNGPLEFPPRHWQYFYSAIELQKLHRHFLPASSVNKTFSWRYYMYLVVSLAIRVLENVADSRYGGAIHVECRNLFLTRLLVTLFFCKML